MSVSATTAKPIYRYRWKNIVFWGLGIALALLFVGAGLAKLYGTADMVQLFAAIGIGQWLRYFTGTIEIVIGLTLLYPATVGLGALLGAITMAFATLANFTIGHDMIHSTVIAVAFLAIAWERRSQLFALADGV
ncbi:MAG: hypothetical protein BGP04_12895 [Rhizobiales bacterium 62-17]|nr:DoxX family protein [Hyphomicrobiales bacterium]OJY02204.1 MAG: hypothetical protein BGP04_12895 [Rhizobiales bacterium 62-17]